MQPLKTADDIAEEMLDIIIPDLPFESGDEVVVLLSGLGATPVMEQYIVYNRVEEILTEKGIKVHRSYVGNYFTSLEMMGVTLTVMKLDDELKECIDMPANSVGLKTVLIRVEFRVKHSTIMSAIFELKIISGKKIVC